MLIEKIDSDLKNALKHRDDIKLGTLRMLRAAIKNMEIEKRVKSLGEQDLLGVIQKQVKQHKDSIAEFEKANRRDLVDKEAKELAVLESYLPQPLTEDELKTLVKKAVESVGAKTKAEMGKVMKEVMPLVAGRADGKQVNQIVASFLN